MYVIDLTCSPTSSSSSMHPPVFSGGTVKFRSVEGVRRGTEREEDRDRRIVVRPERR